LVAADAALYYNILTTVAFFAPASQALRAMEAFAQFSHGYDRTGAPRWFSGSPS
jgi:hypothetical protein